MKYIYIKKKKVFGSQKESFHLSSKSPFKFPKGADQVSNVTGSSAARNKIKFKYYEIVMLLSE